MDRMWRFVCGKTGAQYVRRAMPVPFTTPEDFVDAFWAGVTERTRVIFISHLTSPTALIFPVAAICRRARAAGILTVVDGAHAPGHLPLDLAELGADLYAGACHKWLMAPKGAAFLYARPEVQARLEPLVVSWGWESETPGPSPFIDFHEWQGTRDLAAFLTVPAAIRFQAEQGWEQVRAACHALVSETRTRVNALTGLESLCPDSPAWFGQMAAIHLPAVDSAALKARLYAEYRVEVPLVWWNDADLVRVSFQGYNTHADLEALLKAFGDLLPQTRKI
jgi:isopenicillin-N epimerase